MISPALLKAGIVTLLAIAATVLSPLHAQADDSLRSAEHQKFGDDFWQYLDGRYTDWTKAAALPEGVPTPEAGEVGTVYVNDVAEKSGDEMEYGSIVVVEHVRDDQPYLITALFRARPDVFQKNDDWYEVIYLPSGAVVKTSGDKMKLARKGFAAKLVDGRLWVLRLGSSDLPAMLEADGPEKHVTLPNAGPEGMTIKTDNRETAVEYLIAKPGFVTFFDNGRAWIFREGSEAAAEYAQGTKPEKYVTRIGAGPMRTTLKALDAETIDAFLGNPAEPMEK
ncbi:hypothetical protein [Blastopirellula marina]|uniref:Uncharacterized protein n=1 Tax=Blastopirellula marina TaxID=124 RepID=A0A2S8GM67_9BACT|nr:hypothetical protein [Blastopirellula marina]PQO45529.1 hypothetical protein C5Y93_13875 [Blastopirellula marina]